MSKQKLKLWKAVGLIICLFTLFSLLFLMTMEVEGKVDCSASGVSFDFNSSVQNLSMSNGTIKCNFEGKVPLIFLMGK